MRVVHAPVVALLLGIVSLPTSAQVSFERIIGTGDPLPGAPPGTAINYPFEAQAAGEWIAFGTISSFGRGVYAWDGRTVRRVVDEQTPVLNGNLTIVPFPDEARMDVDALGSVVVYGEGSAGQGVWRWDGGGPVELVVRAGDPSPTAPGEAVLAMQSPRLRDSTAYVMVERSGAAPFESEIIGFPYNGPAFRATPESFFVSGTAFDAGSQLLYRAFDTKLVGGLWRAEPGEAPELLLAPGDPLPGGLPGEPWTGAATQLLRFGLNGAVVGGGGTLGTRGFFVVTEPGVGYALIHHGDPEPRTGQPILLIPSGYASASDHRFAFVARLADDSRHLSVREPDGSFLPILSTGDVLEGEVVTDIWISTKAFASDDRLVAVISRQTEAAIWTIDLPPLGGPSVPAIPTTSAIGLVVLALLLAAGGTLMASRSR